MRLWTLDFGLVAESGFCKHGIDRNKLKKNDAGLGFSQREDHLHSGSVVSRWNVIPADAKKICLNKKVASFGVSQRKHSGIGPWTVSERDSWLAVDRRPRLIFGLIKLQFRLSNGRLPSCDNANFAVGDTKGIDADTDDRSTIDYVYRKSVTGQSKFLTIPLNWPVRRRGE